MDRVVFFSGGVASWAAALRVRREHGLDGLRLLFTDTLIEDDDLYRFLVEAAAQIAEVKVPSDLMEQVGQLPPIQEEGARADALADLAEDARDAIPGLDWVVEGRDPWAVFRDERFMGNTRADPCSKLLKRQFSAEWVKHWYDPEGTVLYLGLSWDEEHRTDPVQRHWDPYPVRFPLTEPPYLTKDAMLHLARENGLTPPRLYDWGFPHNNCGGFCVKAGQAHFKLLLEKLPERYAYHERKEQELREYLDRDDVAILRDRRGGFVTPMTLKTFRERLEQANADDPQCDLFDWGGCGCFSDVQPGD